MCLTVPYVEGVTVFAPLQILGEGERRNQKRKVKSKRVDFVARRENSTGRAASRRLSG